MAAATKRVGIVPTLSTFSYAPYLVARIVGSLDQVSGGRGGWNMVTGSSDLSAQNFGLDRLPPHDQRYDMADEYMEIVTRLWGSWEPGAIVADHDSGVLIDPSKVHTIDYEGQFYRSRGPLNSGPCPQGRPVIAQAGGSDRGRAFAAKHADTIVAHPKGIAAMKQVPRGHHCEAEVVRPGSEFLQSALSGRAADRRGRGRGAGPRQASQRTGREKSGRGARPARLDHQHRFFQAGSRCAGGRTLH